MKRTVYALWEDSKTGEMCMKQLDIQARDSRNNSNKRISAEATTTSTTVTLP